MVKSKIQRKISSYERIDKADLFTGPQIQGRGTIGSWYLY
jgi:hypothetical protein